MSSAIKDLAVRNFDFSSLQATLTALGSNVPVTDQKSFNEVCSNRPVYLLNSIELGNQKMADVEHAAHSKQLQIGRSSAVAIIRAKGQGCAGRGAK